MHTVYVPVKASEEMPPDRARVSVILDAKFLTAGKNISGSILLDSPWSEFIDEDYDRVTWLKPTEAVLLSKEDADRVVNELTKIRNELYDGISTKIADAFSLASAISIHLNRLDAFINSLNQAK